MSIHFNKSDLLEACKNMQLETIDHLRSAMEEAQNAANEYGPPKDRYDSFRTQLLRKRDMYATQLNKANEQLDTLNKISPVKKYDRVEFGSLVLTDSQKLFVSIGLGKVEIEKDTIYAISPAVPIFKVMEGKREGDQYEFNNRKYTIRKIL